MDMQKYAKIAAMAVVVLAGASAIYVAVTESIQEGADLLAIVLGGLAVLTVGKPADAYAGKATAEAGKANAEAEKGNAEAEKANVELRTLRRRMKKRAPWDGERMKEIEDLAAELPKGRVEWFDSTAGKNVEAREQIGTIHFEPEPGRRAQTALILEPDGDLCVNGTSENGRPEGAEIAAVWIFKALRKRGGEDDQ